MRTFHLEWVYPALEIVLVGRYPVNTPASVRCFANVVLRGLLPLRAALEQSEHSPYADLLPDLVAEWERVRDREGLAGGGCTRAEVDALQADLLERTPDLLAEMDALPVRVAHVAFPAAYAVRHDFDLTTCATVSETLLEQVARGVLLQPASSPEIAAEWEEMRLDWCELVAEFADRGEAWGWHRPLEDSEAATVEALLREVAALADYHLAPVVDLRWPVSRG